MVSFFFKRRFFLFLAFIILIVTSNPIVGNYLMQKLEHPYKPISSYSISKADAIVMLSGVLKKIEIKNNAKYEFGEANRFLSSIDLINQNKANKLIYTAGKVPWIENRKPEGYILKNKAISLGVPQEKILVTENVINTYEESIAVTKLIPKNSSIILVTSAFHMNRSKYLFEKNGFVVIPFPVDFRSSTTDISIFSILPSLNAMKKVSTFIKEKIGRVYYKLFFNLI